MKTLSNQASGPMIENQRDGAGEAAGEAQSVRGVASRAAAGKAGGYPRNRVALPGEVKPVRFSASETERPADDKNFDAPGDRGPGRDPMGSGSGVGRALRFNAATFIASGKRRLAARRRAVRPALESALALKAQKLGCASFIIVAERCIWVPEQQAYLVELEASADAR